MGPLAENADDAVCKVAVYDASYLVELTVGNMNSRRHVLTVEGRDLISCFSLRYLLDFVKGNRLSLLYRCRVFFFFLSICLLSLLFYHNQFATYSLLIHIHLYITEKIKINSKNK